VLVGAPWWWVLARRHRKLTLITLAGVMSAGLVVLLLGIFYSLYAFNPDAGR
jgi:hypothetical protein